MDIIFDKSPKIFDQNTSKIQKQKRPEKFFWTPNMPLKEQPKVFALVRTFFARSLKNKKEFF